MHIKFGTMEERFLVYVYVGVWIVQGTYLARLCWQWFHTPKPSSTK